MTVRTIPLIAILFFIVSPVAMAMTTYEVVITVEDPGLSPPVTAKPISGAEVKVKLGPWDERVATEEKEGVYRFKLTVDHKMQNQVKYDVIVSKTGYDTATQPLILQGGTPAALTFSMARGTTTYYLHITLLDADTKGSISGASVVCTDERNLERVQAVELGAQGSYHAQLSVNHQNYRQLTYVCIISRKGYEDRAARFTFTLGDDKSRNEKLHMLQKIEPLEKGQKIHVTVQRSDSGRPLFNAEVKVGPESGRTGADGKVTLLVQEPAKNQMHELTVFADPYGSESYYGVRRQLKVRMYEDEEREQNVICCLKPSAVGTAKNSVCKTDKEWRLEGITGNPCDPATPVTADNLIIIVEEGSDRTKSPGNRPKLSGATVEITKPSGAVSSVPSTGTDGKASFTLDPIKDRGQRIRIKVRKKDYLDEYTEIVPDSFTDKIMIYVSLYKPVQENIDKIKGKVKAKCQALQEACNALSTLDQVTHDYSKAFHNLADWLNKFDEAVNNASRECLTTAALRTTIQSEIKTVNTKLALLKSKMDAANSKATACKTDTDIKELETLYKEIISLTWEVRNTLNKVGEENKKLKEIINRANSVRARFDAPDKEKKDPVSLLGLVGRFGELEKLLKAHRDTLFMPAYNKVKEKRDECIRAHDDAIKELDAFGDPTNPLIVSAKQGLQDSKPGAKSPCDEESKKIDLNRVIDYFVSPVPIVKQRVEDIKKIPLCNGQNAEDVLQAYSAYNRLRAELESINLPEKINKCKGQPSKPTPAKNVLSFKIHPPKVELTPGQTQEFRAFVTYTDGTSKDISDSKDIVTWSQPRTFTAEKDKVGQTVYLRATAQLDKVLSDTAEVKIKAPISNVKMDILCHPQKAKPGDQVRCTAEIDVNTRSSLDNMAAGAWGYYWYINGRAMKPYGRETITFTIPKDAKPGYEYKVIARLARVRVDRNVEYLARGSVDKNVEYLAEAGTTLSIIKQEPLQPPVSPATEREFNATAGKNGLAGNAKIRGFGDSKEVDVWVPFNFNLPSFPKISKAKIVMEVKPIGQLIGTDQLIIKGISGKGVEVYHGFSSLPGDKWSKVEVPISNPDVLEAIKRGGTVEGVIQDDTAVNYVKLIITF